MPTSLVLSLGNVDNTCHACPFLPLSPYAIWPQAPDACHFPQSCSSI